MRHDRALRLPGLGTEVTKTNGLWRCSLRGGSRGRAACRMADEEWEQAGRARDRQERMPQPGMIQCPSEVQAPPGDPGSTRTPHANGGVRGEHLLPERQPGVCRGAHLPSTADQRVLGPVTPVGQRLRFVVCSANGEWQSYGRSAAASLMRQTSPSTESPTRLCRKSWIARAAPSASCSQGR